MKPKKKTIIFVSLKHMAEEIGMSPRHARRVFEDVKPMEVNGSFFYLRRDVEPIIRQWRRKR